VGIPTGNFRNCRFPGIPGLGNSQTGILGALIQIGLTFLVPAYPGCPGKQAVKWVCVYFRDNWIN